MACTDVQTIQAGNGSKTQFSFDFPYIFKSEIHVYFWNAVTKEYDEKLTTDSTYPWRITDANPTIVEFTGTAPPSPATPTDPGEPTVDNVKIRRITKVDDIRALFNPGSAIRSDDLNKNFEQLRYAIQESNCQDVPEEIYEFLEDYYWDNFNKTVFSTDTWTSSDSKIATTAAMDARFQDEATETYTKAELAADNNGIPTDDTALPTTGAVKDYVDHVIETDVLVDSTGLQKSATGGQVTLGIAAGSVDLDRIKPADIITSSESNPNNDITIATTAKIDDMIDAAITGDIAGSDGVSITNDGDGTITVGLSDNSVDLDKIKDDDKIVYAEHTVSPTDSNIFTASAAARRFDTIVQNGQPSGSDWVVGKTWFENDGDKTLSAWTGSQWTAITSGGTFNRQDKVVYVDAGSGTNTSDGHRISTPKKTIKAAIEQINAEINTTLTSGGSGYVEGSYTSVALTGGESTGLTADITVDSNGVVTEITNISNATLQNYSIGDVLSASASNLGGSGSGLQITVGGDGDGQVVIVSAGVYQEVAPIQIKRRNVSIIGQSLRSCLIHPTHATRYNSLFEVNSGSFLQHLTFTGVQAGTGVGNSVDSVLPEDQGWNVSFYNNARILKSPYIQNCTNFSDSEIDNNNLNAHNPAGGQAGDTDSGPTGGGLLVDGSVPHDDSPLRSIVADSYTHVGLNGPGILVTNNGYAQCTSSYAFFNKYHIKALNGGQANLAASTTDFGDQALVADGRSTTAIFTATTTAASAASTTNAPVNTVTIGVPTADSSWHGAANRPQSNMVMDVVDSNGTTTYELLSSSEIRDQQNNLTGYTVTVIRPNPEDLSENLGIQHSIASGADVSFFLRSMIASSGHTMEYVGSGTDYSALPENGGTPDENDEVVEIGAGKIWAVTVNDKGKLKAGETFEVDQQTGFVSIPSGAIKFNNYVEQSSATGEAFLPAGSTGQRTASPAAGYIRFNTTTVEFEGYDGAAWEPIGGSTGADPAFIETNQLLSANKIIPANTNAAIVGPMAVESGYVLTINNNSKLVVLN